STRGSRTKAGGLAAPPLLSGSTAAAGATGAGVRAGPRAPGGCVPGGAGPERGLAAPGSPPVASRAVATEPAALSGAGGPDGTGSTNAEAAGRSSRVLLASKATVKVDAGEAGSGSTTTPWLDPRASPRAKGPRSSDH